LLKLYDIFLRKFILLFTGIFLVLAFIFYFWIKNLYIEQIKTDLIHNLDIISLQIKSLDNLDKQVDDIKSITGLRTTIVSHKGIVIAESDKDKSTMDNHGNRNEIILSKYQEYGDIIRYSDTLQKELLYVAKRYTLNNQTYFIRMARDLEEINEGFYDMSLKVIILFFFLLLLSFWIALQSSYKIEAETRAILEFLKSLTKQKKGNKIESNYSLEFNKITKLLTAVSETLAKKDKQKAKYTAKLKLSNRQKDDIISAISHEFKNPIAVISGYTQTLIGDKNINENIRNKFLQKISSNSDKLTLMIDRLRLSIKLDEGKQQNSFLKTNLKNMIQNQIDDLKSSYPKRDIIFHGDEVSKEVDETLLGIAVINLIENALKYSQDKVEITLNKKKISIKDYGIGIKEGDIENITKKFYRVSSNGWNNSLGVGLSLVANIVKLHKFHLDIESVEHEGSTFSIEF
jgi:signal transduction histidine kinase